MTLCDGDVMALVLVKEITTSFVLVIYGSPVVVMATAVELSLIVFTPSPTLQPITT